MKLRTAGIVIAMSFGAGTAALAQVPEHSEHEKTATTPDQRFEIIQSGLGVRLTLRVDRFSGVTSQLVARGDTVVFWQPMIRLSHAEPDTRVLSRPNYQVFTSGFGLQFTFLININTGATWQLREDPKQGWFWAPIL